MSVNYDKYIEVCRKAVFDDSVFSTFKSNPNYRMVLEHVSVQQGQVYLNEINRNVPYLKGTFPKFVTNDLIGNPKTFYYEGCKEKVSPTTLRYIKVLGDLNSIFKCLDGKDIVEIGVGYGGMCKIIHDWFTPKSYTLIDLPAVLDLSKKCLQEMKVTGNLSFQASDHLKRKDYDLVISNYAFTEIDRVYQDLYLKKVINNSDNGYITCNFVDMRALDKAMSKEELLQMKENFKIYPEKPLTAPSNFIYTWNTQDK